MDPMTELKKLYRKLGCVLAFAGLLLLSTWTQTPVPPTQKNTPPTSQPQQDQKAPSADASAPEQKISPKEAEELFHDVDQILQFASKDTGLPIKKEVKRRLTSRDEGVTYLEKTMSEDKDAQRRRRSELVLKKSGLLPRDLNLQLFWLPCSASK